MKKVFVLTRTIVPYNSLEEEVWLYGKHDSLIRRKDVTKAWLSKNGFLSEGAALKQMYRLPYWKNKPKGNATSTAIESFEVPEHELHWEIYRPFEIVIRDKDGNQVGETQYCYGTRAQAEELADHELELLEQE